MGAELVLVARDATHLEAARQLWEVSARMTAFDP